MAKPIWKPWHEVVKLREDVRTGELSLATFAADLYQVMMAAATHFFFPHPLPVFTAAAPQHR